MFHECQPYLASLLHLRESRNQKQTVANIKDQGVIK